MEKAKSENLTTQDSDGHNQLSQAHKDKLITYQREIDEKFKRTLQKLDIDKYELDNEL